MFKTHRTNARTARLARTAVFGGGVALTALALSLASTAALAQSDEQVTIQPQAIGTLVPTHKTRGDREFDGGPDIISSATLTLSPDGKSIIAGVYFRAEETKGDHSTVEQTWSIPVYQAPAGVTITAIDGPSKSEVHFRGKNAGAQFLFPGTDAANFLEEFGKLADVVIAAVTGHPVDGGVLAALKQATKGLRSHGNDVHVVAPQAGPVALFAIVGDTGGADISDDENPNDDTRIERIAFAPVQVTLSK